MYIVKSKTKMNNEKKENHKLDKIDYALLKILIKNSKSPYRKISKEIGISVGCIHNRIKKMKEKNIILNFTLNLDPSQIDITLLYEVKGPPCFSCIHHSVCEFFNSLIQDNEKKRVSWIKKFLGIDFYDLLNHCNQYSPILNMG